MNNAAGRLRVPTPLAVLLYVFRHGEAWISLAAAIDPETSEGFFEQPGTSGMNAPQHDLATGDDAVAAVVLAGGRSRRMGGGDKALLPLAGMALIGHVLGRLAPQAGRTMINANGDSGRFAAFDLPVVADTFGDHAGPLAGILAAMEWAGRQAPSARWLATAPADTPFIPLDLVARLRNAAASGETIVLARSAGVIHPVVGLYPLALAGALGNWLANGRDLSVRGFLTAQATVAVDFGDASSVDPFFNVNTPADLAAAEAVAGQGKTPAAGRPGS
jgi:molybdopterin-guanine dinucleotide biosynthesis protein A